MLLSIDWEKIFFVLKSKNSENEVAQSCPTLCDPVDTGCSVHGILQARILE